METIGRGAADRSGRPRAGAGAAVRFRVVPRRPYSLALTAERYTRFPEVVDRFDGRVYRRLLAAGGRTVLLSVTQAGPPSRALLEVALEGRRAGAADVRGMAERVVRVALGADADVARFYRALAGDPVLGPPIRAFRGLRVSGVPSLWEAALTAILSQQINLKFAYAIRRELALAFGPRRTIGGETYVAFPEPESLAGETPESLRRFRLSRAKAAAVAGLARAFAAGEISEDALLALSDEAAIERLVAMRGIGRWTAEIALLRGMGRPDIFPAGDLGVVKYLAQGLLGHGARSSEAEMRRFAERWSPHRALALVYGYAELIRRKREAPRPAPARSRRAESGRRRRR